MSKSCTRSAAISAPPKTGVGQEADHLALALDRVGECRHLSMAGVTRSACWRLGSLTPSHGLRGMRTVAVADVKTAAVRAWVAKMVDDEVGAPQSRMPSASFARCSARRSRTQDEPVGVVAERLP
jgi:hypothetical protein